MAVSLRLRNSNAMKLTGRDRNARSPSLYRTVHIPDAVSDQGSMSANERQAFLELQKHLEEALKLARHQFG
jgi:hypothetical protein